MEKLKYALFVFVFTIIIHYSESISAGVNYNFDVCGLKCGVGLQGAIPEACNYNSPNSQVQVQVPVHQAPTLSSPSLRSQVPILEAPIFNSRYSQVQVPILQAPIFNTRSSRVQVPIFQAPIFNSPSPRVQFPIFETPIFNTRSSGVQIPILEAPICHSRCLATQVPIFQVPTFNSQCSSAPCPKIDIFNSLRQKQNCLPKLPDLGECLAKLFRKNRCLLKDLFSSFQMKPQQACQRPPLQEASKSSLFTLNIEPTIAACPVTRSIPNQQCTRPEIRNQGLRLQEEQRRRPSLRVLNIEQRNHSPDLRNIQNPMPCQCRIMNPEIMNNPQLGPPVINHGANPSCTCRKQIC